MKVVRALVLGIGLALFGSAAQANPLADFFEQFVRYHNEYTVKPAQHRVQQGRHAVRRSVVFVEHNAERAVETGRTVLASFYGGGPRKYEPNSHTASGEVFNQWALTAAHRTFPLGTHLKVTYGSKSVIVRVNDRGPALWTGRSLDLSRGAATQLGIVSRGVAPVQIARLD